MNNSSSNNLTTHLPQKQAKELLILDQTFGLYISVSWADFLERDDIQNKLLAAGKKEAKAATATKAKDLVEEMGLPEVRFLLICPLN